MWRKLNVHGKTPEQLWKVDKKPLISAVKTFLVRSFPLCLTNTRAMSKEQLSNFKSFVKLQLPTSLTDEQQEKMFNFTFEYFRKTVNTSRRRFLHLVDTTVATLSQEFDKLVDERESTSVEEKGAFQSKIQSVLNESAMAVNVEALQQISIPCRTARGPSPARHSLQAQELTQEHSANFALCFMGSRREPRGRRV